MAEYTQQSIQTMPEGGEEDTQRGRYLTFTLDGVTYGIPIRFVTEIIGIQEATRVPDTPSYVKGIFNLRGRIIPLVDVRVRFGKPAVPYTDRTCIVVIDVQDVTLGLVVDRVDDVLAIPQEQISDPPDGPGTDFEGRFIEGIGKAGGGVQLILSADKLLKGEELEPAAAAPQPEEQPALPYQIIAPTV
ncbi:MAG: chemotaxis protein CheW [Clostridiales Family XIII bacterium]|nr:chemotaxis protein CheW [Clostridiales Family XIII bacterium]